MNLAELPADIIQMIIKMKKDWVSDRKGRIDIMLISPQWCNTMRYLRKRLPSIDLFRWGMGRELTLLLSSKYLNYFGLKNWRIIRQWNDQVLACSHVPYNRSPLAHIFSHCSVIKLLELAKDANLSRSEIKSISRYMGDLVLVEKMILCKPSRIMDDALILDLVRLPRVLHLVISADTYTSFQDMMRSLNDIPQFIAPALNTVSTIELSTVVSYDNELTYYGSRSTKKEAVSHGIMVHQDDEILDNRFRRFRVTFSRQA